MRDLEGLILDRGFCKLAGPNPLWNLVGPAVGLGAGGLIARHYALKKNEEEKRLKEKKKKDNSSNKEKE